MLGVRREGNALVAFYFVYFCAMGAFLPYWGPWLQSQDQSAFAIGLLTAAVQFSKVIAPNVWGWLLHWQPARRLIPWGNYLAALSFGLLFFAQQDFWKLLLVTLGFSFFWAATLPLVDAVSLAWAQQQGKQYGRIRLWGSLGFIALAMGMGVLLGGFGDQVFLPLLLFFFFGTAWLSHYLPLTASPSPPQAVPRPSFLPYLRQPELLLFLLAGVLEQGSHGVYYAFYSIYVEAHGFGSGMVGILWALAVLAEVIFFWFGDQWVQRWGTMRLFVISFFLTSVRWAVIAWWPSFFWIIVVQVLHAASYAAFHLAAVHWVFARFPEALRSRGMALYASLVYGLGGGLGALGAGYAWSHWGGQGAFGAAAAMALVALVLLLGMKHYSRPLEKTA
ncbi:MAG: MFS transporter [Acidithiobacillus sp.]|nr:MFS transporter [Acidithiobacillus sp.]